MERLCMKIVCAWCGRFLGEKDGGGVEGISHSVCEQCLIEASPAEESKTNKETDIAE